MTLTTTGSFSDKVNFIWAVADLLRGTFKQSEYGKVIQPLVVLRRLDCVLEPTKPAVLERAKKLAERIDNPDAALKATAGYEFYNTSLFSFETLTNDPGNLAANLRSYIGGYSPSARDVIDKFRFDDTIKRLDQANLLYQVVAKFADLDLHPDSVDNHEMGYIYEELIRRFSEQSNETAGEHFTPREVIRLMVDLLLAEDDKVLSEPGIVKTIFDPACGTGGMLATAQDHLKALNPYAHLEVFGQELNDESYAICRSDMMLKGHNSENIVNGNSFSQDGFPGRTFDYLIANPPFGVAWRQIEKIVKDEASQLGFQGRFGAGLPRINDGSLLFLQHMISKMKTPEEGGSRVAIVFNGSPLFTGGAGSGESEIRRWIIENDWLEAVVALPDQLFYNTGISTYFWIVTNRKNPERKGLIQLVDARNSFVKMRKSLGEKRKEISPEQIKEIVETYGSFTDTNNTDGVKVKILPNETFGFLRINVERPLRLSWGVTTETADEFKTTKTYEQLTTKISGVDPEDAAAAFTQITTALTGKVFDTPDSFEDAFAAETIKAWKTLGWEYTDGEPPTGRNAFATAFECTPAIGKRTISYFGIRNPDAPVVLDRHGNPEPDSDLSDNENVPLPATSVTYDNDVSDRLETVEYRTTIDNYMVTEVLPYVPDAWVDHTKTRIGYEIPLTRHFYTYTPPRPLAEIDAEIKQLEAEIQQLLAEVTE